MVRQAVILSIFCFLHSAHSLACSGEKNELHQRGNRVHPRTLQRATKMVRAVVDANNPISHTPDNLHRLTFHQVCFDQVIDERIMYVKAKVTPDDMIGKKGTKVERFPGVKKALMSWSKPCGCDECGHIVPRSFGGHGYAGNMFAQNANLNRQLWNTVCKQVSGYVNDTSSSDIIDEERFAFMKFGFSYKPLSDRFRPAFYFYHFEYSNKNGVQQHTYGLLENEDHSDATLEECSVDRTTKLNFVSIPNDGYYSRRSCKPDLDPSTNYGPWIPPFSDEEDMEIDSD